MIFLVYFSMMFIPFMVDRLTKIDTNGTLRKIKLGMFTVGAVLCTFGTATVNTCGQGVVDVGQNIMIAGILVHYIDKLWHFYGVKHDDN